MAILMLETNQRIINTDHIVTVYVSGREDSCQITIVLASPVMPIDLPRRYKSFDKAETALRDLAKALVDADITTDVMEMRVDGVYR